MQTEVAEVIYEKVKILPVESQREVLDFVNGLRAKPDDNRRPNEPGLQKLWRDIDEIVAAVPEEAWEGVPTDGSINVDHYLYGAPKRPK